MIHNLYVIEDGGICLYSYNFIKNISIDEQLLAGFLSAIGSFAQETFKTGLQSIQIHDGQKLIFYVQKSERLTFCAIANEKDNNFLLEKILSEVARKFILELKDVLDNNRAAIDEYKIFDSTIKESVKNVVKDRNFKSVISGLLLSFIVLTAITIPATILNEFLRVEMSEYAFFLYFLISLTFTVSSSSFVSGFQSGNSKYGTLGAILVFIFINLTILTQGVELYLNFLFIAPLVLIACIASGYYGGLTADRRKLYPLIQ